ncbi:DUF4402 domain-containing protein [Salegentibacter salarius]|uniref:DUF4402 domain-containing protein n=1 Tax=Salegentibacter salarius TaxID=435906 RepID=A0A2N0U2Z3_9FLAO|nr:DUF4402 domain-containing protein [Salegentibacter salarius]OEY71219.1 hypothetical protein BHS39_07015 [Salegentibacter salarius]PKD21373.1 hypothetical protein APR40_07010 [Salegentibacter salarius]SLJ92992.1 protein of unknown function [Salegentibacter salarius]
MKKITFILLALISGTAFAQTATANAAADIVSPLQIAPTQALNFGKVSNNIAGSVVIDADGAVSGLSQIGATTPTPATFDVTAADGFAYSVTLPTTSVVLTNTNSDEITVDNFVDNAGAAPEGTGSSQTIGVGATLNVEASQPTGNYTGTFDVSVAYE